MKSNLANIKVIMIILFLVTILFAILGAFNILPIEGFNDDVLGCSGEVIPTCHENVLKFANYKEDENSEYILKTQMVVPTCPSCPAYNDSHEHWDNNEINWKESKKDWRNWSGSDWDNNEKKDEKKDEENDDEENNEEENDEEKNKKENPIPIQTNIQDNLNLSPVSTPAPINQPINQPIQPNIQDNLNQPTQAQNTCVTQKEEAPCPACERCPEPAFECKKVPNYRSPSINNYMPVPVLNSFSKF